MNAIFDKFPTVSLSHQDVGMGKVPCPLCEQTQIAGTVRVRDSDGKVELCNCPCDDVRNFWRKIHKTVPERYRGLHLFKMEPSPLAKNASFEFQQQVIDHCKATVSQSQFFIGPVGCGKTALQYAIWHQWVAAVVKYGDPLCRYKWPCWNIDTNELMDQHHAWVTRREGEDCESPLVTAKRIKQTAERQTDPPYKSFKPVLVLREIDKLNPTQFKLDTLFKLIGHLHDHKGILLIDSNLDWDDFVKTFGEPIARRVKVMCWLVDYYNETIQKPSED